MLSGPPGPRFAAEAEADREVLRRKRAAVQAIAERQRAGFDPQMLPVIPNLERRRLIHAAIGKGEGGKVGEDA